MIPATFVKGLLSPGTQKVLRSSAVFKREASFDGLLVQCTLLKRPPEGGVHNERANISSSYNNNNTHNNNTHNSNSSSIFYWATPDECHWVCKGGSRMLHSLLHENGYTQHSTTTTTTRALLPIIPLPHLTMVTGIIRMSPCESRRIHTSSVSASISSAAAPIRVTIQLSGETTAWVRAATDNGGGGSSGGSVSLHHTLCSPDPTTNTPLLLGGRPNSLFGCCELAPLFVTTTNTTRSSRRNKVEAAPPVVVAVSAHYPNISISDLVEAHQKKDESGNDRSSSSTDRFVCGATPGSIRKVSSSSIFPNFLSDNDTALHMKLNVFLLPSFQT